MMKNKKSASALISDLKRKTRSSFFTMLIFTNLNVIINLNLGWRVIRLSVESLPSHPTNSYPSAGEAGREVATFWGGFEWRLSKF